ncbi:MAG: glutamate racemase [Colwellia sp.]|nr:glutamate racemase [Colwellia sp.]
MRHHLAKNKPSNSSAIGYKSIGVMDSGVGGLSVLQHINSLLPDERLTYVADSQYAPYGSLSAEKITERCFKVADFLIAQDVKALVVACNTATAASIQLMRAKYTLPIIGMEPAVKPAALASKNGIIGVLATVGTLKSTQFAALLATYGQDIQVYTQACIGLVECIERGETKTASTKQLLGQYCSPLLNARADTIVLGCSHYPLVRPLIDEIVGKGITVIDTGAAVAKRLQTILATQALIRPSAVEPDITIWLSDVAADRKAVIQQLWGKGNAKIKRMG